MKRHHVLMSLSVLAIAAASLTGCGKVDPIKPVLGQAVVHAEERPRKATETADPEMVWGANAFSLELFKTIEAEQNGRDDIVLSPVSAAFALGMVQQGAKRRTAEELAMVLGTPNDVNAAGRGFAGLLGSLKRKSEDTLEVDNGMWLDAGMTFQPRFLQADRDYFGAEIRTAELDEPGSITGINDWIGERTHGRIKQLLDPEQTADKTLISVLVNTIYFKGGWEEEFLPELTRPRDFAVGGGAKTEVPTMEQGGKMPYLETASYQAVRLGYRSGKAMYVFLPKPGRKVSDVARAISGADWTKTQARFDTTPGRLLLPRFKAKTSQDLIPPLTDIGLVTLFGPDSDLSGISDRDLYVSQVRQAAEVETDEKGTVAAAATGVALTAGASAFEVQPFEMRVDRPFMFVIADDRTDLILFAGAVRDPR